MRNALIFAAGLLVGSILAGSAATAAVGYPFYSLAARYNGAAKPLVADTNGYLYVVTH